MDVHKLRRAVPAGRKAWWLGLVVLALVAAVALLDRGSAIAAITYVLS